MYVRQKFNVLTSINEERDFDFSFSFFYFISFQKCYQLQICSYKFPILSNASCIVKCKSPKFLSKTLLNKFHLMQTEWKFILQCTKFSISFPLSFQLRISSVNVTNSTVSCVLQIWSHLLKKFLMMENLVFCSDRCLFRTLASICDETFCEKKLMAFRRYLISAKVLA